jgi:prepilin peptidase CpaA
MALRSVFLAMIFLAMVCVLYYDGRWRCIPNFVTLPLLIIGALTQLVMNGWPGLASSLCGLCIGAGLLLPLYLVRGMGAGDLKLAAAIGACTGIRLILSVLFFAILSGGLLALLWILLGRARLQARPAQPLEQQPLEVTLPYGWAIVSGTIVAICMHPMEVWL